MRHKTRNYYTLHVSTRFFYCGRRWRGSRMERKDGVETESRERERAAWAAWVPQMTPTEPIVRTNQIAVLSMWLCGIPC